MSELDDGPTLDVAIANQLISKIREALAAMEGAAVAGDRPAYERARLLWTESEESLHAMLPPSPHPL
ncbi:MAG: hypothetical protein JWM85_2351 [Acidimicrobiaceae bacterium]|nr:hypothetical protein [Acidimicrobiaceae bacterium]